MDDLNAQQIVLLTLLVSFITSIATGITTVSLLEQAPEPVTQTINRIVETTIERIIIEPAKEGEAIIEREIITIVVNEEDLTIEAVEKNSRSLVRLYRVVGDIREFVAIGIVTSSSGNILTDTLRVQAGQDYIGVYQEGEFTVGIDNKDPQSPFVTLKLKDGENTGETPATFEPAVFANSDVVKLGQSVISLSGSKDNTVSTGITNRLEKNEMGELSAIVTSVSADNVLAGSIILNLQGEIIGLKINGDPLQKTSFIPSNMVKEFLSVQNIAS